jgi:hypothetical protein
MNRVSFTIVNQAAWAPGVHTLDQWRQWAAVPHPLAGDDEPAVAAMPAMLRRRAGFLGKMALEVAYACTAGELGIPTVFCSRHGEVGRAVTLLEELRREGTVSPTGFGLAVHNASAGLFSIARKDRANHIALAGGSATVEHALIEACGLLADGAPRVLLVAYDAPLPEVYGQFEDCLEQAHAFAWMIERGGPKALTLAWEAAAAQQGEDRQPGSLEALRFVLGDAAAMSRHGGGLRWTWSRDAR